MAAEAASIQAPMVHRPSRPVWPLVLAGVICLCLLAPILSLLTALAAPSDDIFVHLLTTVLPGYVANSVILMLITAASATALGSFLALLIGLARFPGRRFFDLFIILPLALPTYIAAYVYTDLFDFAGPVQTGLRAALELPVGTALLPPIRSLGGAAFVLTLVLYPYAYLIVRGVLALRRQALINAARGLGCPPWRAVWRLVLPACVPAMMAAFALIGMDVLADYGVAEYFGINTLAVGVYRVWFGMGSITAAAQLAVLLLLMALLLLLLQSRAQRQLGDAGASHERSPQRFRLSPFAGALACLFCAGVLLLGFVLPSGWLFWLWLDNRETAVLAVDHAALAWRTLWLAAVAAMVTLVLATLLALGRRAGGGAAALATLTRLSALGYAVPGSVVAIAVLGLFGLLSPRGLIAGGALVLVYAYALRFIAPALGAVSAGLDRLSVGIDRVGAALGRGRLAIGLRLHLPLLRRSLLTGGLLVLVEVMKELPITLALRPFDFETLATRVYRLASDERLAEASGAALLLVLVGFIPVVLLLRSENTPSAKPAAMARSAAQPASSPHDPARRGG